MTKNNNLGGIEEPKFQDLDIYSILFGMPMLPEEKLSTFDDSKYEKFTKCWLYVSCKSKYKTIESYAGAGDKGRDVIGIYEDGTWDNYQCKQYNSSLTPTTAYKEIGKIIYYTKNGDYTAPKKYYFVAPKGIGPKLKDYLNQPELLKSKLIENWNGYCRHTITKKIDIELDENMQEYINSFNFEIFSYVDNDQMIEDLRNTKYFKFFFGGGFEKPRKTIRYAPENIDTKETVYIECLLKVYSEYHGTVIQNLNELESFKNENEHFKRQRISFFSTEALKEFAAETLPSLNAYYEMKKDYHDVLYDLINDDYPNGYKRLKEALKEIVKVDCTNNVLSQVTSVLDKKGFCHHLANDGRVKWVIKDE